MKDIEMNELLAEWKTVLGSTASFIWKWIVIISKFIWKNTVKFSKWLWGEIKKFAKGATWITVVIICMLLGSIFSGIILLDEHRMTVASYVLEIDSLSAQIDSLEVNSKTDILLMKAGEYHITAHSDKAKITKDSVASLLIELGAWYPDIIMAQIQTESNYGTSDVAINANNLLGMKKTGKRKTTQIKKQEYKGYGKYNNWESCVIDRVMWDYEFFGNKKPTRENYVERLNQFYAESNQYGTAMNRYGKNYKKYL